MYVNTVGGYILGGMTRQLPICLSASIGPRDNIEKHLFELSLSHNLDLVHVVDRNDSVYDYNQYIDWLILVATLTSAEILMARDRSKDNKRQEVSTIMTLGEKQRLMVKREIKVE